MRIELTINGVGLFEAEDDNGADQYESAGRALFKAIYQWSAGTIQNESTLAEGVDRILKGFTDAHREGTS